jgi:hypothetical protein
MWFDHEYSSLRLALSGVHDFGKGGGAGSIRVSGGPGRMGERVIDGQGEGRGTVSVS